MRTPRRSVPLDPVRAASPHGAGSPRSPSRRVAALGGLATAAWWAAGCGGGGGGGGGDTPDGSGGAGAGTPTVPSIAALTFSPTAVTAGSAPVTLAGSLTFVDAGADLATLTFELVDAAGATVGAQTVAVGAAAGVQAGTLSGSVVAVFPTPGAYRVRASVRDAAGNASNVLEGPLRVAAPPWTARAPMPTPREGFAFAAVGGRVYAIGGTLLDAAGTPKPATGTLEAWDPATDRWTTLAPMPTPRSDAAVAVVDGRILVFGGDGGQGGAPVLDTVEAYDPATDTWLARAAMPSARRGASAATLGTRVSVIGGVDGGADVATHSVYDAAADAWLADGVPLPSARRQATAFTLLSGGQPVLQSLGGFASTGTQNAGYLARWERLGTGPAAWSELPAPPTPRARAAVVQAVPSLYAVGGGNVERALATVEAWDLTTLSWRTRTPLPAPAATPGAALLADGRIVVVDGRATWTYVPADDLA